MRDQEVERSAAIFESAGQAVHVAYLIMSVDAKQESILRQALIQMLQCLKRPSADKVEWLTQLRGIRSGTVNFAGLDSYEVRAQCAMITQSVKTKLPAPEMWALQARYGHTQFEDVDGVRRFAFSAERIDAIKSLSDWMVPSFSSVKPFAMDCLIGKVYADHKKTEISFRDLANSFGQSHMLYARAFPRLKKRLRELETMATDRLTPYFISQGVVQNY